MSSMGFTVSTHICEGQTMESVLTVGKKFLDCGMMDMKQGCSNHSGGITTITKAACCSNEYATYSLQDDFNAETISISVDNDFLYALVCTHLLLHTEESDDKLHINYSPPLLHQDIPVLNQSFLI